MKITKIIHPLWKEFRKVRKTFPKRKFFPIRIGKWQYLFRTKHQTISLIKEKDIWEFAVLEKEVRPIGAGSYKLAKKMIKEMLVCHCKKDKGTNEKCDSCIKYRRTQVADKI